MKITPETSPFSEYVQQLGFRIKLSSPRGEVQDDWPHIVFDYKLFRNDKFVFGGTYRMGVGHVNPRKKYVLVPNGWDAMLDYWATKPTVQFTDKKGWAGLSAWLAAKQRVRPDTCDLVHSILLDGQPDFDSESFESWASNCGYDTDSRKAEATYRACVDAGRALRQHCSAKEIESLRNLSQDL